MQLGTLRLHDGMHEERDGNNAMRPIYTITENQAKWEQRSTNNYGRVESEKSKQENTKHNAKKKGQGVATHWFVVMSRV